MPCEAHLAFYHCLILSLIDDCCVIWGNASKENLDRSHRLQKRGARLILDGHYEAPLLPLFLELGWLPIHEQIKFLQAVTIFKALNGLSPSFITDLLHPLNKVHNINMHGCTKNLKLPKVNTNFGKRIFAFLASSECNLLPVNVKNYSSLSSFRKNSITMAFSKLRGKETFQHFFFMSII